MAGLKQHFLPQFLMKGFQSRISDGDPYTWICWKDGRIFEAKAKNIGKEIGFYGFDGPDSLDENISDYEKEVAPKIDQLRQCNSSCEIYDPSIADFVAHIAMRTRHLREAMADALEDFSLMLMEYMENPDNLILIFKKGIAEKSNPKVRENELHLALMGLSEEQQESLLVDYVRNNIEKATPILQECRRQLEKQIRPVAFRGQLNALAKDVISTGISVEYRKLHWHLLHTDCQLILGDLGVLNCFQPGAEYRIFPEKGKPLESVFLPISSNHLLIGSNGLDISNIRLAEINAASARNSKEFFIGPHKYLVERYRSEIGTHNPLITDEELKLLFEKAVQE